LTTRAICLDRRHFQIAVALALQPPARLHAKKIAVDVELDVDRGMIPRPSDEIRLHSHQQRMLAVACILGGFGLALGIIYSVLCSLFARGPATASP
jgi:hypothetical protein